MPRVPRFRRGGRPAAPAYAPDEPRPGRGNVRATNGITRSVVKSCERQHGGTAVASRAPPHRVVSWLPSSIPNSNGVRAGRVSLWFCVSLSLSLPTSLSLALSTPVVYFPATLRAFCARYTSAAVEKSGFQADLERQRRSGTSCTPRARTRLSRTHLSSAAALACVQTDSFGILRHAHRNTLRQWREFVFERAHGRVHCLSRRRARAFGQTGRVERADAFGRLGSGTFVASLPRRCGSDETPVGLLVFVCAACTRVHSRGTVVSKKKCIPVGEIRGVERAQRRRRTSLAERRLIKKKKKTERSERERLAGVGEGIDMDEAVSASV